MKLFLVIAVDDHDEPIWNATEADVRPVEAEALDGVYHEAAVDLLWLSEIVTYFFYFCKLV
jgi:hypothetical protein